MATPSSRTEVTVVCITALPRDTFGITASEVNVDGIVIRLQLYKNDEGHQKEGHGDVNMHIVAEGGHDRAHGGRVGVPRGDYTSAPDTLTGFRLSIGAPSQGPINFRLVPRLRKRLNIFWEGDSRHHSSLMLSAMLGYLPIFSTMARSF